MWQIARVTVKSVLINIPQHGASLGTVTSDVFFFLWDDAQNIIPFSNALPQKSHDWPKQCKLHGISFVQSILSFHNKSAQL